MSNGFAFGESMKEPGHEWYEIYRTFGYEGEKYVCYYWMVALSHISFGIHVDFSKPNIEIHLPFGFIRIGKK